MKQSKTEYVIYDTENKLFLERSSFIGYSKYGSVFELRFVEDIVNASMDTKSRMKERLSGINVDAFVFNPKESKLENLVVKKIKVLYKIK